MVNKLPGTHPQSISILVLVAAMFAAPARPVESVLAAVLFWFVACLAAETLYQPTRGDEAVMTMAPAAHLPALLLLPGLWGLGVIVVSATAGAVLRRRAALETAGYVAGVGLGGVAALIVVGSFGLQGGLETAARVLSLLGPLIVGLAGLAYLVVHQGLIAAVAAHRRRLSWVRAWRLAFGYGMEMATGAALILVATLGIFCFQANGPRGALLCVMPLLFVRDGFRRYIDLKRAQAKILLTERMAAKGEMAAEIGHELNNYLAAISGRAQLMELHPRVRESGVPVADVTQVRALANKMSTLAKGLMDFSHRETKRTPFAINDLVLRTVELVRPQARFQTVAFQVEADPRAPLVEMDPGQIQQALLMLLRRTARAAKEGKACALRIHTGVDAGGVAVRIAGGAPGVDLAGSRAFALGTAVQKDDPELGTVARIMERHQGELRTGRGDPDVEGYQFILPAA